MTFRPFILPSAHKHGVTFFDVRQVIENPYRILPMPELADIGLGQPERPNVDVYAGYDSAGSPLVVFVDRFERVAFHSEPGLRRFGSLF